MLFFTQAQSNIGATLGSVDWRALIGSDRRTYR